MKQKVKGYKRNGKLVRGYSRRKRSKGKGRKSTSVGVYKKILIRNSNGEVVGNKLIKIKK